jgi:hypothetical protein
MEIGQINTLTPFPPISAEESPNLSQKYSIHTTGTKNNSDTKELAVFELRCTRKKRHGNLGS